MGHYTGTPEEELALDTYIKLVRCSETLTQRLHRHLAAVDLTISQFGVLEALLHLGPLCQRDLAHKLLKTGGNLTLVIDNLEKRTLVRRERSDYDRRLIQVHLTHQGDQLIRHLFPRHVAYLVATFGVLTPIEQQHLGQLTKKLGLSPELSG